MSPLPSAAGAPDAAAAPGATGAGRRVVLGSLVLFLASLALYAPTAGYDFVDYDDTTVLLRNPTLYGADGFTASVEAIFGSFPREEPLLVRDLTWALDGALFGFGNPRGYHLGNVVWNALAVALFPLWLWRLTRRPRAALAAGAAFALLAVHVEPVAWIMGRKDLVASAFMLAALWAHTTWLQAERPARGAWLLGLACTALALFAKINAVALVGVLVLLGACAPHLRGERPPDAPFAWREAGAALPALLPHIAVTLFALTWYKGVLDDWGVMEGYSPGALTLEHARTLAVYLPLSLARYAELLVWPAEASVAYWSPRVSLPLTAGDALLAAGVAAAALVTAALLARWRKDAFFFAAGFAALMLPYSNLVYSGHWVANRYLYLSAGFLLAGAALLLGTLWRSSPRPERVALAAGAAGLMALQLLFTLQLQPVWRDEPTLWTHETALAEPNVLAFKALAKFYVDGAEAEPDPVRRAALLAEGDAVAVRGIEVYAAQRFVETPYFTTERVYHGMLHHLRGRVAGLRGDGWEIQRDHYLAAARIDPDDPVNAIALARAYLERADAAESDEREALARESLRFFDRYASAVVRDPRARERNREILRTSYAEPYPALREAVLEVAARVAP